MSRRRLMGGAVAALSAMALAVPLGLAPSTAQAATVAAPASDLTLPHRIGPHTTPVIFISTPTRPYDAEMRSLVLERVDQMVPTLDALSAGRFQFRPVPLDIRVYDPCLLAWEGSELWRALSAQGFEPTSFYSGMVFYPPGLGSVCGQFDERTPAFGGAPQQDQTYGYPSWRAPLSMYSADDYAISFNVILHEYLHSLGLPHANTLSCLEAGRVVPFSYDEGCRSYQYGDQIDIMGGMSSTDGAILNAPLREALGWLPDNEVVDISGNWKSETEIDLPIYSISGQAGQVVRIDLPAPRSGPVAGASPGTLYLTSESGIPSLEDPSGSETNVMVRWNASSEMAPLWSFSGAVNIRGTETWRGWSDLIKVDQFDQPTWDLSDLLDHDAIPSSYTPNSGIRPGKEWADPTGRVRVRYVEESKPGVARIVVTVQGRTPLLEAVRGLRAELAGDQYRVSWSPATFVGERSAYRVTASSDHDGPRGTVSCEAKFYERSCDLPDLYANTRYSVQVTPVTADGVLGPTSAAVSLQTASITEPLLADVVASATENDLRVEAQLNPAMPSLTGSLSWLATCVDVAMPEHLRTASGVSEAADIKPDGSLGATLSGNLLGGRSYDCEIAWSAWAHGYQSGTARVAISTTGKAPALQAPQIQSMHKFRTAYRARLQVPWQEEYLHSAAVVEAKCVSGRHVVRGKSRPGVELLKVYKLKPGRDYDCRARQVQGAVKSPWGPTYQLRKVVGSQ